MSYSNLPQPPVAPCQCCQATRCLGHYDTCNALVLPLEAAQTGTHRVNWQQGGVSYYSEFDAATGLNFEVPREALPYPYIGSVRFAIVNPDGTTYAPVMPDGEVAPNCFEVIFVVNPTCPIDRYATD